ncbi:MAG TPA: lamin tail domain-containing protein, partial [Halothiobacillaceae bacterium]|nr:lamin tail domain-containing protein [Halothiobacillaceae bacterium]
TVYLHSGANGILSGYSEQEKFDASDPGVTLGRYEKSTGTYNFVALIAPTPGAENADPLVGPVVISEIMYHPAAAFGVEYVELLNISDAAVTLYDAVRAAPWRFTDDPDNPGIEFLFPTDDPITLAPGEYLILTKDATQLMCGLAILGGR